MAWLTIITALLALLPLLLKLIEEWKAKGEVLSARKKKLLNKVMGLCQRTTQSLAEMGCTPEDE